MKPKTIIISGSSEGLGYQLIEQLAEQHQIIGLSRKGVGPKVANAHYYKCDLRQLEQIKSVSAQIIEKHPTVDVLINNAAVLKTSPLALLSESDIASMVETNFLGVVYLTKSFWKHFIKNKFGRVINIISMSHKLSVPGDSVYAATKSAVESFSKVLNKEGHPFGITVNNVGVSATPSGMLDQITKTHPHKIKTMIPHGEYADLPSILNSIYYLCDEKNQDIGGQSIYLGGI